ncbi:MAG: hypothetical protein R6V06_10470 [Kiritimatiellia bacterium]
MSYAAPEFGRTENYPHIGLMLPPLARSKPRPLQMPEAHAYIAEIQGSLHREDRFAPFDLWYRQEHEGRWEDAEGNMLFLGRITYTLPAFQQDYVTRDEFAVRCADSDWQIDGNKPEMIHEWVSDFSGNELYEPQKLNINSIALSEIYFYPSDNSNRLVYAFHPRRIGNARNFDWFCVILHTNGAEDPEKLQLDFEDNWIAEIKQAPASSKDDGIFASELDTSREGIIDFDQPDHPVRTAARKSVENYKEWWYAETDGYIILSDVNTDLGKSLVERIQKNMPILQESYRRLLPPLTDTHDISLIRIFQFKSDYDRHVGNKLKWSSGIWMPKRRELALTQEFHTEEIMRTLRHESFHQYISYAWGMLTPPPWLNEGHACFFENARIDSNKTITFEEDPKRLSLLLDNIETATALIPLMFEMDYREFYEGGGSAKGRSFNYALAWALAYYLQKGAPQERNTPFKSLISDYAASLAATAEYKKANELVFADFEMQVFQSNFMEFWLKRRATAIQYDPLKGK